MGCQVAKEKARGLGEKRCPSLPGWRGREKETSAGLSPPRSGLFFLASNPDSCLFRGAVGGEREARLLGGFSDGPSPRALHPASERGPVTQEVQLEVEVSLYLGRLLLVKLRKHKGLVGFDWFCKWIAVQGPGTQGEAFFPCYRWVQGNEIICLPEGTGEGSGKTGGGTWWAACSDVRGKGERDGGKERWREREKGKDGAEHLGCGRGPSTKLC